MERGIGETSTFGQVVTFPGWKKQDQKPALKENQDTYLLEEKDDQKLIGILDGHGKQGHLISNVVKIALSYYFRKNTLRDAQGIERAIDTIVHYLEENHLDKARKSGTTACIGLIKNNTLRLANVGDSTCCLFSPTKYKVVNTHHSFRDTREVRRVEGAGGMVKHYRLNGTLNLSRAIGDFRYQQSGLISTPDQFNEDLSSWTYVVMGSDGLFDHVSMDEISEILFETDKALATPYYLANLAQKKWIERTDGNYCDDVTVLIVPLRL